MKKIINKRQFPKKGDTTLKHRYIEAVAGGSALLFTIHTSKRMQHQQGHEEELRGTTTTSLKKKRTALCPNKKWLSLFTSVQIQSRKCGDTTRLCLFSPFSFSLFLSVFFHTLIWSTVLDSWSWVFLVRKHYCKWSEGGQ